MQSAPAGPGWQEVLAWVWVCAAAAMLLWALVSYLSLRVRLWDSQRFEGRVYVSKRIGTAFVSGLIRPKIYLPENLSGCERECVLAHERCHIRRGDHLIKPLAYIALCLHWFNPLVWLAWVLAMRDMEASCDEAAIKRLGGASRADYAQTLLNLAAGRSVSLAVSLSFGDDTKRRIRAIARIRPARRWITVLAAVLAVGVIAGCAANPAPSETGPDNTPGAADAQSDGRYASVYDMLSTGYERSLGSVTWSSDGVSVFPATDWRIENLEKVCEIDGLDPDAVIEGWTYDVWFQLDTAEEDVNIAGGMQRDGGLVQSERHPARNCAALPRRPLCAVWLEDYKRPYGAVRLLLQARVGRIHVHCRRHAGLHPRLDEPLKRRRRHRWATSPPSALTATAGTSTCPCSSGSTTGCP